MYRRHSNSGVRQRPPTFAEDNFTIAAQLRQRVVVEGTVTPSVNFDLNMEAYTTATVDNEANVVATELTPLATAGISYEAMDPSVATVNAVGQVTRVVDGNARVDAFTDTRRRRLTVTVSRTSGTSGTRWASFVNSSMGKHLVDSAAALISTKNPATDRELYSASNHAAGTYTRNTNCWLAGVTGLTCISPWNSAHGVFGGTLISPRHAIATNHAPLPVGATLRWVTSGNVVVSRTITDQLRVVAANTDLQIIKLDSDVPGTIAFAKVLPTSVAQKLKGVSATAVAAYNANAKAEQFASVPWVTLNQFSRASISALWLIQGQPSSGWALGDAAKQSATFSPWYEAVINLDSGQPTFLIVNGELVLTGPMTWGGSGGCTDLSQNLSAINSAMTTLGGGYQLTQADLSAFPTY